MCNPFRFYDIPELSWSPLGIYHPIRCIESVVFHFCCYWWLVLSCAWLWNFQQRGLVYSTPRHVDRNWCAIIKFWQRNDEKVISLTMAHKRKHTTNGEVKTEEVIYWALNWQSLRTSDLLREISNASNQECSDISRSLHFHNFSVMLFRNITTHFRYQKHSLEGFDICCDTDIQLSFHMHALFGLFPP